MSASATAHLFRLYAGDELGDDGYPPIWHLRLKHQVREETGNRCCRCGHPYSRGEHPMERVELEPGQVSFVSWSPCDERCVHRGKVRIREAALVGQVAFIVGYHHRSKGFANNVSALSSAGLIQRGKGTLSLSHEGEQVAVAPDATPTDEDLQRMIYQQIGPKRTTILQYLIDRYSNEVPVDELAAAMDYHPRSKGFSNSVSSLSGLGLIVRRPGFIRAAEICFVR